MALSPGITNMTVSPDDVLKILDSHSVEYTVHNHPAVATVDAQASALSGVEGLPTKNLFLKDKKHRYYVCTALPDTKVDLKVLSARMGLGKGGVSMASETALQEVLQLPLGSVTPLYVCNPAASQVVLFLDSRIKSVDRVFVHPLVNTTSIALSPSALETVLKQFRPTIHYVDLQADPKIDKDNPPDLKHLVDEAEAAKPAADGPADGAPAAAAAPSAPAGAAAAKAGGAGKKKGGAAAGGKSSTSSGTGPRADLKTEDIIDKVAVALLGKKLGEVELDPYVVQRLHADVEAQLNALRNSAFASGYTAGKGELVAYAQRTYA